MKDISCLLIDDDPDDQDMFCLILKEIPRKITCLIAGNGQEALQKLPKMDPRPDLIVLDLNMPIMNGFQFLQEIQHDEQINTIPVIAFSTSSDLGLVELKKLGALEVFTKPNSLAGWEIVVKKMIALIPES